MIASALYRFLRYLLWFYLYVFGYWAISSFFVRHGGFDPHFFRLELPLLTILAMIFYFPSLKASFNAFLVFIMLLTFFIPYDIFFLRFDKPPTPSDLENAILLFHLSILLGAAIFLVFVSALVVPLRIMLRSNRLLPQKWQRRLFLSRIVFALLAIIFFQSSYFEHYLFANFKEVQTSKSKEVKVNGRLASFFYYGLEHEMAKVQLQMLKEIEFQPQEFLFGGELEPSKRKNIYIIVLESWIDPRLIEGAEFNASVMHSALKEVLKSNRLSQGISPVYGGATAQSEFEILSGLPALSRIKSIEFNALNAKPFIGLVQKLKSSGYHTYAMVATSSIFYNAPQAYKSLGFDKAIFLEETNSSLPKEGDLFIYDGDLFGEALKLIKSHRLKEPYLFYMLGMYGHVPIVRNKTVRPDRIKSIHQDEVVTDLANFFWYRTKELGLFLKEIIAHDPNTLILVVSDHLPPVLSDTVRYKKDRHLNILLLIDGGKPVALSQKHYYELPRELWKRLTGRKQPKIEQEVYPMLYLKAFSTVY